MEVTTQETAPANQTPADKRVERVAKQEKEKGALAKAEEILEEYIKKMGDFQLPAGHRLAPVANQLHAARTANAMAITQAQAYKTQRLKEEERQRQEELLAVQRRLKEEQQRQAQATRLRKERLEKARKVAEDKLCDLHHQQATLDQDTMQATQMIGNINEELAGIFDVENNG
eukprot:9479962-Pyramimonas_sp.AAC.1